MVNYAPIKLVNFLKRAAGTGEVMTIAYNGGSRPGKAREVVILSCSNIDMRVREPGAPEPKLYNYGYIVWAENSSGERVINPMPSQQPQPTKEVLPRLKSLLHYIELLKPELQNAGWHVHEDYALFGVGGYFKNGKPKKTPSIAVRYFDRSTVSVWDLETNGPVEVKKELTGRERPWRVDSWRFAAGKTFRELHPAMEVFISEVRATTVSEAGRMCAG